MELSVVIHRPGAQTVVEVHGDIDIATAPVLTCELKALLDQGGHQHLIIDLGVVQFLDSTGLGVLIGAQKQAASQGGSVVLVCTNPRLLKILRITRLHRVFTIHPAVADALAQVTG
jgi:anti-sigma B factor antagonist